jgi:hypothetical protein
MTKREKNKLAPMQAVTKYISIFKYSWDIRSRSLQIVELGSRVAQMTTASYY